MPERDAKASEMLPSFLEADVMQRFKVGLAPCVLARSIVNIIATLIKRDIIDKGDRSSEDNNTQKLTTECRGVMSYIPW